MHRHSHEWNVNQVGIAARFLDRRLPGWNKKVDPLTLDLSSCTDCVCGQNGVDWNDIGTELEAEDGIDLWPLPGGCIFAASHFTQYWLEELAMRLPDARLDAVERAPETTVESHAALA